MISWKSGIVLTMAIGSPYNTILLLLLQLHTPYLPFVSGGTGVSIAGVVAGCPGENP